METKTFAELNLSAKVQQAITATGYTTPTPIQAHAIPVAMEGRDVLGIAQTGTGKTASFVLPMISRLETGRARARMPRSLILAPTRELAAQVAQSFEKYGVNHKLDVALLIGGVSMDEQTKKLDRGVDVLIATPGRLLDHFQRGRIMLMGVEILVIDEADRMLDMGFIPDIEKICKLLPPRRQTLFFSATMPAEITRLTQQFLTNPVRIEVAPPATTAKTIIQRFVFCPTGEDWHKRESLRQLLKSDGVRNAIIFCNRKVEVAILLKSLLKHGFNAGALHGDMDQKSRTETLDKFRSGDIAFLAASDVAARGLDIPDVSHVFNYDLPRDKDDYVHRIGRTGRAGKEGHSISLVAGFDLKQLQEIEKIAGEPAVWTGDAPSEQDYADAGKRKRGRTSGSVAGSGRPGMRGGRERPMAPRGGDRGPRPGQGHGAPQGERRPRGRPDDERPQRREMLNTGQRHASRDAAPPAPGFEPQPDVMAATPPVGERPREQEPRGESRPQRVRHRRGGGERQGRSNNDGPRHPHHEQPREARTEQHREPRSEQPRAPREPREPRDQRPAREQPRAPQQAREPRQPQAQPQAQRGGDRTNDRGASSSFADNVPAFLQKPVRPVKAASE